MLDDSTRQIVRRRVRGEDRLELLLFTLKIANLLAVKHDYIHRRTSVVGGPIGYLLDPVSGCNLGCPSCPQSFNKAFVETTFNPWPKTIMKPDVHDKVLSTIGLRAFSAHYYNTSEPMLNKHLSSYIGEANRLRIKTALSSHMSIPRLDVEGIVASGLDVLQIAVDGATQPVYERYRKGGDIALVFDNVRRLVSEKKRRRSSSPRIRWHYLTFKHNVHEIGVAIEIARNLEVNDFFIVRPVDVSADDPSVEVAMHPSVGQKIVIRDATPSSFERPLAPVAPKIEAELEKSWMDRFADVDPQTARVEVHDRCDWLYMGIYINALAKILPCVIGDTKNQGKFQFGQSLQDPGFYNSPEYIEAREIMNGITEPKSADSVRCHTCNGRPAPLVGLSGAKWALQENRRFLRLSSKLMGTLCDWSDHQNRPHWVSADVEQVCL
jgi:MoaA/NifB/PqqE/SkfB family radical SAM enzyme